MSDVFCNGEKVMDSDGISLCWPEEAIVRNIIWNSAGGQEESQEAGGILSEDILLRFFLPKVWLSCLRESTILKKFTEMNVWRRGLLDLLTKPLGEQGYCLQLFIVLVRWERKSFKQRRYLYDQLNIYASTIF